MSDQNPLGLPTPPPPAQVPPRSLADESPTLTANDSAAELEALLEQVGVPPLLPLPWQYRQRMQLKLLVGRMSDLFRDSSRVEIDDADIDAVEPYIDFIGDIDDLFLSVARNPRDYTAWSSGLENAEQVLLALFTRYARAVGESMKSADSSTSTAPN
jgi:hypothetical protein